MLFKKETRQKVILLKFPCSNKMVQRQMQKKEDMKEREELVQIKKAALSLNSGPPSYYYKFRSMPLTVC